MPAACWWPPRLPPSRSSHDSDKTQRNTNIRLIEWLSRDFDLYRFHCFHDDHDYHDDQDYDNHGDHYDHEDPDDHEDHLGHDEQFDHCICKLEVIHKEVGGCLTSYNLQLACVSKLEVSWPDARALQRRSLKLTIITQSVSQSVRIRINQPKN